MGEIKFGEIFVPIQSMSIERNFYPAKILCYTVLDNVQLAFIVMTLVMEYSTPPVTLAELLINDTLSIKLTVLRLSANIAPPTSALLSSNLLWLIVTFVLLVVIIAPPTNPLIIRGTSQPDWTESL